MRSRFLKNSGSTIRRLDETLDRCGAHDQDQDQIYEYACHEGNYGLRGIVGARAAEKPPRSLREGRIAVNRCARALSGSPTSPISGRVLKAERSVVACANDGGMLTWSQAVG